MDNIFQWHFFWQHLFSLNPNYWGSLGCTISMAVIAQVLGILIGAVISVGRLAKARWARSLAGFYVWFLRGIPELVLLVLLFTGLSAAGIFRFADISLGGLTIAGNYQAAIVAFALREGAYMAEIIRTGVQSVDRRQLEAARALGMDRQTILRRIIVPQALRVIVPPLGNDFNVMLKVTTLASVIGVQDLLLSTQTFASSNFRVFELFIGLAINYLVLTTVWSFVQSLIESRLSEYESEPGARNLLQRVWGHLVGAAPAREVAA